MPPKKYQDRGIWIYTGTEGRLKLIREEAKKRGIRPSKYLMAAEEGFRRLDQCPSTGPELEHLRQENRKLENDLKGKDLLLLQQETELRKLRGSAFLQPTWDADIDSDLLKAIRAGPVHDHRLLDLLGATDQDSMRAVSRQLQILEAAGFIANTAKGWCWKK
jgi:hypothetical protein